MRAIVDRRALADAMSACLRAVDRRATIPICEHFLVRSAGGRMRLTATDLDMQVSAEVMADVVEDGEGTLLADMASGIVARQTMPSVEMLWFGGRDRARIVCGRSRCEVPTRDPRDFPAIIASVEGTKFTMPGAELRRGLETCLWAASDATATEYQLCGVYIHPPLDGEPRQIRFVGANRSCFAFTAFDLPVGAEAMPGVIVPTRAAAEVARMAEGDVEIEVTRNYCRFAFASGAVLTTKVIDGTYPNYRVATERKTSCSATMAVQELVGALDRIALAVDAKLSQGVKVEIGASDITLERRDSSRGLVVEVVPIESTLPPGQTIGLNASWLSRAAKAMGDGDLSFSLARDGSGSGAMIRPAAGSLPLCGIGFMAVPA